MATSKDTGGQKQTTRRAEETEQAEAALTQAAGEESERPGTRTAVAALRLAHRDPRAALAALAPVLDGSDPGGPGSASGLADRGFPAGGKREGRPR